MEDAFNAVKVSEHVWWVGAIDWAVRDFHGYQTRRGSTYNAYLVQGDDTVLIDTVKAAFRDELMKRIASVIGDPSRIRYIIANHAEPDHSGSLPEVVAAVKPEKVFASRMGVAALNDYYGLGDILAPVENMQTMKLAGLDFRFMETRMIHWPDSMFTYLADDRLLFSQDGFSMHLASSERFDDELDEAVMYQEAATYYANILLPFAPIVKKAIAQLADTGWEIKTIAPDHGPVWRRDVHTIVNRWSDWSDQRPTMKAAVLYDTMWGSTHKMARAIGEGLAEGGASADLVHMHANHRTDAAAAVLEAGALIVGTPTLNNNMFPSVADALTYLKGLRPKNKIGAVFGSYGWGGEGTAHVKEVLDAMKVELVGDPVKVRYAPDREALAACHALGLEIAHRLRAKVSSGAASP